MTYHFSGSKAPLGAAARGPSAETLAQSAASAEAYDAKEINRLKNVEAGMYWSGGSPNSGTLVQRPQYTELPVGVDAGEGLRCLPDQFFAPRWCKSGVAWTDKRYGSPTNGQSAHWEGIARSDMEQLCDCITNPRVPKILQRAVDCDGGGRGSLTDSACQNILQQITGGGPNTQARIDFCWTRMLQNRDTLFASEGGWSDSPGEPQFVKDAKPKALPMNVRVKNFPNPCRHAPHVPPPCSVRDKIDDADSKRRGHTSATVIERQPAQCAWMFGTYRIADPATQYLETHGEGERFRSDVDRSPTKPAINNQQLRDLNTGRGYSRNAFPISGLGSTSNVKATIAVGAVGLSALALCGAVLLLTRK